MAATVEQIVEKYTLVVGVLDQMFLAATPRCDDLPWRDNGVGSCKKVDKESSEDGLRGRAKARLIKLREQRAQDTPGKPQLTQCPYHRTDVGCILAELKSPLCIGWFDNPGEWRERFDIDAAKFRSHINKQLDQILRGDFEGVETFVNMVNSYRDQIEQEPRIYGGTPKEKLILLLRGIMCLPRSTIRWYRWRYG